MNDQDRILNRINFEAEHGGAIEPHPASMVNMPNNWRVKLTLDDRSMEFNFYGGSAVKEIDIDGVIEALTCDARLVADARSPEEWCSELGFDVGKPENLQIYEDAKDQTRQFKELLGDDYESLMMYV